MILLEKHIVMDVSKAFQRSTQRNKASIVPSLIGFQKENLIIGTNQTKSHIKDSMAALLSRKINMSLGEENFQEKPQLDIFATTRIIGPTNVPIKKIELM